MIAKTSLLKILVIIVMIFSSLSGVCFVNAEAVITLPKLISDNMLIQQGKPVRIWGTGGNAGDIVEASLLNTQNTAVNSGSGSVAANGKWSFEMPSMTGGGPYTLKITVSGTTKNVSNVLVGELWVLSGQSNMERMVYQLHSTHQAEIVLTQPINEIRLFKAIAGTGSSVAEEDLDGSWVVASSSSVATFSAVGFSAMKELYDRLKIPVGGIMAAYGGSFMSQWMGPLSYGGTGAQFYNRKIAPITKSNVRGVMWYQGESDRKNTNFTTDFSSMIASWRTAFNNPRMPFIFVQLPVSPMMINDGYGTRDFSTVRMAQLDAYYTLDNVGMAVAVDCQPNRALYNDDPLHPSNKKPVGQRLAYSALALVYGKTLPFSGPMYKSMSVSGDTVTITFNYVENGLKTVDNQSPRCFKISGSNGVFYDAEATIVQPDKIMLKSASVSAPLKVYYSYDNQFALPDDVDVYPNVNLVNSAGLPASPFVTDTTVAPKEIKPFAKSGRIIDTASTNSTYTLPITTKVSYPNGTTQDKNVIWINGIDTSSEGKKEAVGLIENEGCTVAATVYVSKLKGPVIAKPYITDSNNNPIDKLTADTQIKAHVPTNAAISDLSDIRIILALYDSDGKLVSVSSGLKTVAVNEPDEVTASMNLSAEVNEKYYAKVYVWSVINELEPLSPPALMPIHIY